MSIKFVICHEYDKYFLPNNIEFVVDFFLNLLNSEFDANEIILKDNEGYSFWYQRDNNIIDIYLKYIEKRIGYIKYEKLDQSLRRKTAKGN